MINTELLQLTLKTIKENPEHWDQTRWHCGTSHCFAGFAELIENNIPLDTPDSILVEEYNFGENFYSSDEKQFHWYTETSVRRRLGITPHDADVLFYYHNTLQELEEYVNVLIKDGSLDLYDNPYLGVENCLDD
jgi:hypothetical protein